MALDLIIGIFQRRDELANAARALRHEQKPDADLLVVCTLAGHRQGRRSAGQGIQQFRVPEIGADKPFKHPLQPENGRFPNDGCSALRSQNERENILTRFRLMTDYSTFLKLKLKRNPDRETLYRWP